VASLSVTPRSFREIYNSLFKATTITGRGHTVDALPIDKTLDILRKYRAL
jgi:D-aminopeptidase